jgi:hypothetical protein
MSEVSMDNNPNAINSASQNGAIRKYLEEGGRLTPLDALRLFSCFRLAARIKDLRRLGVDIRTDYIRVVNESGKTVTVGQYSLEARQ